jgi:hypothetical protein
MTKYMEEPGEQFIVVFALIVTEPSSECVCVGGGATPTTPPTSRSVTIYAKTTVHCSPDSSMAEYKLRMTNWISEERAGHELRMTRMT